MNAAPASAPENDPHFVGGIVRETPEDAAAVDALVIAAFASLIAPFGGFFASGVKRAFRIKDFGDTIPGHGGITDRFDCHGLMGIFVYIYLTSFVYRSVDSFEKVMDLVNSMSFDDKSKLLDLLRADIAVNYTMQ